jgi:hypothetical protein
MRTTLALLTLLAAAPAANARLSLVCLWRRAWLFRRLLIRNQGAMLGIGVWPVEYVLRCQPAR